MASRQHNRRVFEKLDKGDLIEFPRELYSHWAVYIGGENIIHFDGNMGKNVGWGTAFGKRYKEASVRYGNIFVVADQHAAWKNNEKDKRFQPQPAKEIVRVAKSMVGQHLGYNMIYNNCEHFASFCRYGVGESEQSDWAISLARHVGNAAVVPIQAGRIVKGIAALAFTLRPSSI